MKLPPGRYHAKCLYHTFTVNSAGNPEIRLSVVPYHVPPEPPFPAGYTPAPLTIFMTITPATIGTAASPGWVLETLKHLKFDSTDLTRLDPASDIAHSFTGIEVEILGTADEFKGKSRVRWNILRNTAEAKPIAQSALEALSDRYRDALKILLPKNPPPQPKTPLGF